ncbi:hypothetical protein D4740_04435 [Actinomyces sp. 2119]|nr:hypothetical protein D4740_04435 [Actinomyces sp. 2119]
MGAAAAVALLAGSFGLGWGAHAMAGGGWHDEHRGSGSHEDWMPGGHGGPGPMDGADGLEGQDWSGGDGRTVPDGSGPWPEESSNPGASEGSDGSGGSEDSGSGATEPSRFSEESAQPSVSPASA